jgi:hypothetical protein
VEIPLNVPECFKNVTLNRLPTASLWDVTTAEKIGQFEGNFQPPSSVDFDPEHNAFMTWTIHGETLSHPCDSCAAPISG